MEWEQKETMLSATVEAYGSVAIHETVGGKGWTVSHVPTGLALLLRIRRRDAAKKIAQEIMDAFPLLSSKDREECRAIPGLKEWIIKARIDRKIFLPEE
jgi:hypothetical protein